MKVPLWMRRTTKANCKACGKMIPIEQLAYVEAFGGFTAKGARETGNDRLGLD